MDTVNSGDFSVEVSGRSYGLCGSAPADALEYNATAKVTTEKDVSLEAFREQVTTDGWKITGSVPPQGIHPERLTDRC